MMRTETIDGITYEDHGNGTLVAIGEAAQLDPEIRERIVPGGHFALDVPDETPAIWGRGDVVGWAAGEATLIVGPTGVGKTTLAQRIVLARIGLRDPLVLGLPVTRSEQPLLYVAADRPRQAQRSLARMVAEEDRAELDERLAIWKGPLDFDCGAKPEALVELVLSTGAGTVVLDSAKDVCLNLSKDEAAGPFVRAWSLLLREGIEVLVLHHQRKASSDNRQPRKLDDVFGSAWLTAGAGSVLILWGDAGDPVLDLHQLKPPAAGEVGPLKVLIDKDLGEIEVDEGGDLWDLLRRAPNGLTAREGARALYGQDDPTRAKEKRTRRSLEQLVERGLAYRRDGDRRIVGSPVARYFAAARQQQVLPT